MNWTRVQTLLRVTEADKMLDHGRDIPALQSLDVTISNFPGEERVFGESLFDLMRQSELETVTSRFFVLGWTTHTSIAKLPSQIDNWCEDLINTQSLGFLGDNLGHFLHKLE